MTDRAKKRQMNWGRAENQDKDSQAVVFRKRPGQEEKRGQGSSNPEEAHEK